MSDLHWMPFYIADYLADTAHLSTEEHGAYLLLIMHYWQHNGLPDDDARLARIARLPPDRWQEVRPVLRPFFGVGWFHRRIDDERVKAEITYAKRSQAGKKGGRPRKDEKPGNKPEETRAFSDEKPGLSNHSHNHHTYPVHIQEEETLKEGCSAEGEALRDADAWEVNQ